MPPTEGYSLQMSDPRPDPFLIADDLALDFLNSICAPWGSEIEWIDTAEDLVAWLEAAGLDIDAAAASPELAQKARDLREWFRSQIEADGPDGLKNLGESSLAPLNDLLAEVPRINQVVPADSGPQLNQSCTGHPPLAPLYQIALAMAELITEADPSRVRKCEGPTCTLWFRDTSRSNRRRWCSMAVCGNRAKVAAFRSRQKDAEQ